MAAHRRRSSLTEQVVAELLETIRSEYDEPGRQLPAVDKLAAQMNVGRSTMREALRLLQARGIIEITHGRGTFVTQPHVTRVTGVLYGLSDILRQRGMAPSSKILECKVIPADKETVQRLQLAQGARVNYLKRLRLVEEVVIGLEISLSPYDRFSDLFQAAWTPQTSLYALLRSQYDVNPTTATQRVSAVLMDEEESALFDVKPQSAALRVESVAHDQYGVPFELVTSCIAATAMIILCA